MHSSGRFGLFEDLDERDEFLGRFGSCGQRELTRARAGRNELGYPGEQLGELLGAIAGDFDLWDDLGIARGRLV